mgnify:CR=1 FL=1|tara:strand:+ start:710 stop:859 length:150 start_codon:yes stop_codon:yes gene_type:complete
MNLYDEYAEARNIALFKKLNKLTKNEIIEMIISGSSEDYLEMMYEELCL